MNAFMLRQPKIGIFRGHCPAWASFLRAAFQGKQNEKIMKSGTLMSKLLPLISVCSLVFLLSCKRQAEPVKSQDKAGGASMERTAKRQRALAEEIVSVEYAFGEALVSANKTDGASFASEVNPLSTRLEKVSKELDTLGPFPPSLREVTRKGIDDKGKIITGLMRYRTWRPMQPEIQKKTEKAVERYFVAWGEVCAKAGLDENASVKPH